MPGIKRGTNPRFKTEKGVGWNRTLPAPFGFDNCIQGDGTNDYLKTTGMGIPAGKFAVEFWLDKTGYIHTNNNNHVVNLLQANGSRNGLRLGGDSKLAVVRANGTTQSFYDYGLFGVTRMHIVINFLITGLFWDIYVNGELVSTQSDGITSLDRFYLCGHTEPGAGYSNTRLDEFRVYSRNLTSAEIGQNYNSGFGNNPFATEILKCWYQFQKFESLDFSVLQNGSDMRTGIRDMSGNNKHAQPFNMDTNPASGSYVLKPF